VTAPACGSCGAPVPDGYLCTGCARELRALLLTAANISGDLDDATAKLLRRGGGGRRTETESALPIDLRASDTARALRVELACRVNKLLRPKEPWPVADVHGLARWLVGHGDRWSRHPESARMLAEIRRRVGDALAVIDRAPERVPAGNCAACGARLLAELGTDMVTCACGTLAEGLQDKRARRAAAADVLGTAAEISGALERIGISVPRGTITSWASRGRLTPRPGGVYALSDVLALHAQRTAKARG
jgi:hypothetical protein